MNYKFAKPWLTHILLQQGRRMRILRLMFLRMMIINSDLIIYSFS